jgi:hypothetical protein
MVHTRSRAFRSSGANVPREHGFWVLLAVTVGASLLRASSWTAFYVALVTTTLVIISATIVGKRVRKNIPLQAAGSTAVAFSALPILVLGEVPLIDALALSFTLTVAFLSGTFCVQAVLYRAKKLPKEEKLAASASVLLPLTTAALANQLFGVWPAVALALVASYTLTVALLAPSARGLRPIGLSISALHIAASLLAIV